jgi:hypothetical protein
MRKETEDETQFTTKIGGSSGALIGKGVGGGVSHQARGHPFLYSSKITHCPQTHLRKSNNHWFFGETWQFWKVWNIENRSFSDSDMFEKLGGCFHKRK